MRPDELRRLSFPLAPLGDRTVARRSPGRSTGIPPRIAHRAPPPCLRRSRRRRTTPPAPPAPATDLSILNPAIFDPDAIAASAAAYAAAEPYTHGVVTPLCDDARLRAVQQEMKENLTATFKETDLFKVLQTGDLVTIDQADPSVGEKIPELLKLRAAIYSPEFRDMVQRMTGCAPLTDRIDCSANVYPRSGHLLCHDDVIGTRCISYIIYLTDPDDGWSAEDGGALELYPVESPGTPAVDPTKELLPAWNSMAFFTVQPGRSFHSVQEVFAADKPRLSISGWYHAAAPPREARTPPSRSFADVVTAVRTTTSRTSRRSHPPSRR